MMEKPTQKDVEKTFGVLQAKFTITQNLPKQSDMTIIDDIMI